MSDIATHIWAKSPYGGRTQGESLDYHSRQLIHRLLQLSNRSPKLAEQLEEPRFWHRVFWACFLHDFGKVAEGFQLQLQNQTIWGQRHEVLSLAFLPWVAKSNSVDYVWMAAGIVSHHKDAGSAGKSGSIFYRYLLGERNRAKTLDKLKGMVNEVKPDDVVELAAILRTRIPEFFKKPEITRLGIQNTLQITDPLEPDKFLESAPEVIMDCLEAYSDLIVDELERNKGTSAINRQAIALRGIVLLADRLASSHASEIKPSVLPQPLFKFDESKLRSHQIEAQKRHGSVILSAPTGSGKTEAALLWARKQQTVTNLNPCLIYVLPYQASMNAMQRRLHQTLFGIDEVKKDELPKVALMHGRSTQVLYKQLTNVASTPQEAEKLANRARSMAGLYQPSVWVATPYQLLKGAFRLPGYEMLFTAVAGARLIIDEIHAYEPKRLGLFIELLAYLKKYWQVEICVMTATMPDWLRKLLKQSLEIEESHEVKPDPTLFKFFRRHRLHRLEGNLENPAVINFILEQFNAGKSVLVCANTVKAAQKILSVLQTYITEPEKLILLHSRFTGEDRLQKESEIKAKANAELQEKIEQGLQTAKPLVVVATQVIEVSLDLSFNRIVSEPAPLEALAQRFGRVNRRGNKTKPPAPVYVLTNATDDMINQKIYDKQLLEQTQQLIEQQDGSEIDEASLTDWLNQIYEAENIGERFSREVELSRQSFRGACINSLRAFDSDENLEETFDKLFDGMEVLPAGKLEDYKEKLKESALAAAALLVPISYTQFIQFKDKIQRMPLEIETEKEEETKRFYVYVANLPYSFETGLGLVKE